MASHRQYEITVFGATGWTATVCAEHIVRTFPNLKTLKPDRVEPSIYIVPQLDAAGLDPIVCDTHVLINGIGPYHRHGTPVVKACARNGTHYVDFSTETAWIAEMVRAYHELAQELGAVIIPATSGSSSPSDLVAWLIARCLKDKGLPPASEVVCSGKLNMLGMQGGSLHTVLDVAENYGIEHPELVSLATNTILSWDILEPRSLPGGNESIVQRSAGIDPQTYGRGFIFREYVSAAGFLSAAVVHLATKIGILLLSIPLFRSFVRSQSFDPGSGPDREESRKAESAEWRAAGYVEGKKDLVVVASFGY
ncbi:hypothetical protein ACJ41O_008631 [Fusarium nematophilum]